MARATSPNYSKKITNASTSPYTLTKRPAWSLPEQAVFWVLCTMGLLIIGAFGAWWFQLEHIPQNFDGWWRAFDWVLFFLLTYVVWYQIANELFTWWTALYMKHPVPTVPQPGLKVALATAFVPGKEPYDILEQTMIAMRAVRYPHDCWILDEGDDDTVKELCKKHGVHHFSRKGIKKYNATDGHFKAKTKAGNYNAWFDAHGHQYEIIAQHDVDFAPKPEFLEKTLGYFKDPEVAFVGTPQIYGNVDESWIARAAAEQAYGFYGPIQQGLFGQDMQLFIGANHVFRTAAHDSIGGYSGHIVEDHLTGMRLYAKRWKSVFVPEILLVGEGPATWDAYFSQQMRWAYGLIDILFRYTPKIASHMRFTHALNYILLQQYYFFGVAQFLGLVLIGLYFVFGISVANLDLTTLLILYPSFLIIQILMYLWLQRVYIDPARESGFHFFGKFLNIVVWPIYFLALISALVGRKIVYQVTPKGNAQTQTAPPLGLFVTQIAVVMLTIVMLVIGLVSERQNTYLLFWTLVTLCIMGGVLLSVLSAHVEDLIAARIGNMSNLRHGIRRVLTSVFVVLLVGFASFAMYQSIVDEEEAAVALEPVAELLVSLR